MNIATLISKLRGFLRLQKDTDADFPEGSPFAVLGGGGPAGHQLLMAAKILTPGGFKRLVHHRGRNNCELVLSDRLTLNHYRSTNADGDHELELSVVINHQVVGYLKSNGERLVLNFGDRTSYLFNAHDLLQLNEGETHLVFDILTGVVRAESRMKMLAERKLRKLAQEVETYRSDLDCE